MTESVHIILSASAVGGMEKRLSGLFLHLVQRGEDVRLVAPRALVEALGESAEHGGLLDHGERLHLLDCDATDPRFRERVGEVVARSPDGVFHYCLASPFRLHRARTKRTLYTIPNASLSQYSARGLLDVYGGILRSTRVDVLDPNVFATLSRRFPWRRGSFSLTPGSYVDLDRFAPLPAAEREDAIVFLGLFSDEKQAPRLVEQIPDLVRALEAGGVAAPRVWLMGRDSGDVSVTDRVARLGDPRVRAWLERDPARVLPRAKVFLSLQRSTNHPSKSLLEAMACGLTPVVTDTRDSRRSAPERLAEYVPRDFTAADLAQACLKVLRRGDDAIDARTTEMRAFLERHFSMESMATYYRLLFEQLRALPPR
ncbi:MAG: glycosyltransferase [Labilithrix sp.]|nr:glycosyltransferase [Labilithrix sp.]MCW5832799.1 glycosyltransferase [Labilithrix sp.]